VSIAFSDYNDLGHGQNPANFIAFGLGWGNHAVVNVVAAANVIVPTTTVPPDLNGQLAYIAQRWQNSSEAERRIQIDAFIQAVMRPCEPPAPIPLGQQAPQVADNVLCVSAEQSVAYAGTRGTIHRNTQVGHGKFDYLIGRAIDGTVTNSLRPSLIIEAKDNLGPNLDFGQWQLCAQMATARQVATAFSQYRRTRGVLSDGRRWRFYELDTGMTLNAPVLTRSDAYDAGNGLDRGTILRLLQKFIEHYARGPSIFSLP